MRLLGSRTTSAPVESGPHSHFWPEIVRKSRPLASSGIAPTDCAPSTRTGTPHCSRSSRSGSTAPVVHSTREVAISRVRGVTAAAIRSGSGGTTTTRAPDAARGPSSPKCSSVVVTISSPGWRPSPRRTIPQPSVVDVVSATVSGSAPTSCANATRSSSRSESVSSNAAFPVRPCSRSRSMPDSSAFATGRASGPNVPALRYATDSSTGNSARASSNVTRQPRRSPRRRDGRRARGHSAAAARPARRSPSSRQRRARGRGRFRRPAGNRTRAADRRH